MEQMTLKQEREMDHESKEFLLRQLSLEQEELEAEILKAKTVLSDLLSKKKKIDDKIKMMYRRTTKKNNRTAPQLSNGQIVVLNSGKGTKRDYNGMEAEVLEYPSRGCWMTVAVREHGTVSLKWRKGQYSVSETTKMVPRSQKQLLQLIIDSGVLVKIFGFLGSSNDIVLDENGREQQRSQLPFVKDAGIVYSKLTRVNKTWRRVCNENAPLIFGRLNVNLDALPVKKIVTCIHWLCKHKFSIGSLIFKAELGDVLFLEQLLNKCDTSKLTFIRAYCQLVTRYNSNPHRHNSHSQWVSEAYHHEREHCLEGGVIDLCGDAYAVSLEAMSRAVDVPYCFPAPTQRQLHDTIAANCEKLFELEVSIAIPNARLNCREYLSETLFSLNNIYRLEVSLGVVKSQFNSCHFDGMIVTRMVENLEKIRELTIKGCEGSTGNRQLFIASPTLTALNVSGLCKLSWISGALPRLETFSCKGGWYGNGTVPQFTAEQLKHVWYAKLDNVKYSRQDFHFYAGQATIRLLDVPPTCEFIMSCGGAVDTPWVLQNFLNARFETFE
jgi:hypothetical protein